MFTGTLQEGEERETGEKISTHSTKFPFAVDNTKETYSNTADDKT
jgi:hypothetical protein